MGIINKKKMFFFSPDCVSCLIFLCMFKHWLAILKWAKDVGGWTDRVGRLRKAGGRRRSLLFEIQRRQQEGWKINGRIDEDDEFLTLYLPGFLLLPSLFSVPPFFSLSQSFALLWILESAPSRWVLCTPQTSFTDLLSKPGEVCVSVLLCVCVCACAPAFCLHPCMH